jgi:hypothetical protein
MTTQIEALEAERDRLSAEILTIEEDIVKIKSQLEHSEIDGNPDPHWAVDARTALRYKNRRIQERQGSLAKVNRQIKAARQDEIDRRFADAAKRLLPREVFDKILAATR